MTITNSACGIGVCSVFPRRSSLHPKLHAHIVTFSMKLCVGVQQNILEDRHVYVLCERPTYKKTRAAMIRKNKESRR